MEGGKDGKVGVNLNAALTWLEKIHKEDKIDVSRLVLEVNRRLEEQERQQMQVARMQSEMKIS